MKKISYEGERGYFITETQKKQIDNVLKYMSIMKGADYNENESL